MERIGNQTKWTKWTRLTQNNNIRQNYLSIADRFIGQMVVDELYLKWLYCFYRDWTDYENGLYTGEFGVRLIVLLKENQTCSWRI